MKSLDRKYSQNYAQISPETEAIGKKALDAAFKVHTALGPGLLESAYETCLAYEIRKSGLAVQAQLHLPVRYDEIEIDAGFRIDMIVEKEVIIELKAVDAINALFEAQLLTYMKLAKIRLGYLINFNVVRLKHGIKRMIL